MGQVKRCYIESQEVFFRWVDSCTRTAGEYLDEVVGNRSHFMIGQYDIVVGTKYGFQPFLLAAHDPTIRVGTRVYDADRLTMHARVIETLWALRNEGRQHPLQDQLLAAIQEEVEGWGRKGGRIHRG